MFVPPESSYQRSAMKRWREDTLQEGDQDLFVCSAEDIILAKLQWSQLGEGVSERQWLDIMGVIKVQGQELDVGYLQRWAAELGLSSLLRRAARGSPGPGPTLFRLASPWRGFGVCSLGETPLLMIVGLGNLPDPG